MEEFSDFLTIVLIKKDMERFLKRDLKWIN